MNVRPTACRRGFTLIEIMVAIAIFALLVAAVYSTWVVILKSSQVGQEVAAQAQRQRIVIRTLEDSLTCIQSFQASMQYYAFNVTNGDQPVLSFVARVPDVFPRNGKFDSNLRRLTFTMEPVSATENDLLLRQNEILQDMDAGEQATPLVLARHVDNFAVECWDTNAVEWVTDWNSTNSIPPMVRVTLTLGGNPLDTGDTATKTTLVREIAIPSSTLPSIAQTGSPLGPGGLGGGLLAPPVANPNPNNPNNPNPNSPNSPFNQNSPNNSNPGMFRNQ